MPEYVLEDSDFGEYVAGFCKCYGASVCSGKSSSWCDALFVQAVADFQNVAIHIIESHENLAGETLVEPHYLAQHPPRTIYLGYLNKLYYVSTAAVTCGSDALENQPSTYLRSTEQNVLFKQPQNGNQKRLKT